MRKIITVAMANNNRLSQSLQHAIEIFYMIACYGVVPAYGMHKSTDQDTISMRQFGFSIMKKIIIISIFFIGIIASAQNNNGLGQGLQQATSNLKQNMTHIKTFLYVIAGIIGFYGAIRVYSKHKAGDQDTNKAMSQFGFGFIFLLAATYVISAFFGI